MGLSRVTIMIHETRKITGGETNISLNSGLDNATSNGPKKHHNKQSHWIVEQINRVTEVSHRVIEFPL
jgi:hypothetical protein